MANSSKHRAVLLEEAMYFLQPRSGGIYLDATFGGGGHSRAILERSGPTGKVWAIDRDPSVRVLAQPLEKAFPGRFQFRVLSFEHMKKLGKRFDGLILDLGLSTDQLEESGRGFSFSREEPLDMRFNPTSGLTAADILNQFSVLKLEEIFHSYAEDRYWKRLAQAVVARRREQKLRTTSDLIEVVGTDQPKILAPIFQGLRIAVNDELAVLQAGLQSTPDILKKGGRLVVISFHSLEDRIVKQFFQQGNFRILTKQPTRPTPEEIRVNRRSRSAKLRAGEFAGESAITV